MLYIFDRNLNFQGIIEGYFSLRWVRRYSKCGEFELHCGLTIESLNLLKKGNIVWKKDDLEAGYISYRSLKKDVEGKEIIVVRGKFLTGYLGQRIIWGTESLNTTAESGMRQLIDKNCINPINVDRKIDLFTLGQLKNYPDILNYQVSYRNLLDEIESIADTNELGIRTLIDVQNKLMEFDVYKGLDRTASQSVNAPSIFSKEFENILEQEFVDSSTNYRNLALIAGEGEGALRQFATIGQGEGLDRFELFVDGRDLQQGDLNNEEYSLLLENRGQNKLSEYTDIQTFDSKINLNSNLTYKEDFDLGDLVTCTSKKWGIAIDTRITEIEEVYDSNGKQINIVYGNNIPTLIDKIKAVIK